MRTFIEYDSATFQVKNLLETDGQLGDGITLPDCIVEVTDSEGPWLGKIYNHLTGQFTDPPVVNLRINHEMGPVRINYEIWRMWKDTRSEAVARSMAAGILTALQNRENAAWSDYARALQDWVSAS